MNKDKKSEAQLQLEAYRKTGIAYLSEEDLDMDFSSCDAPPSDDSFFDDQHDVPAKKETEKK
jgi:hypothetical protein